MMINSLLSHGKYGPYAVLYASTVEKQEVIEARMGISDR
jgi:hypothetical protein